MTQGNIEAIYPLTAVQDGILFHTLYAPESPLYIQQYTCRLHGELDEDAFVAAWQTVIDRHVAMRSLLTWEGREQPLQIVRRTVNPRWQHHDWRGYDDADTMVNAFLAEDRDEGFALDVAPLMRFALLRLADDVHQFVWTHHHIVLDGWSLGLALAEVFVAYEAATAGRPHELAEAPSYREYVRWLKERDTGSAEAFWRRELSGFAAATPLTMQERPAAGRWAERHGEMTAHVPADLTKRLTEFARTSGLTMNTLFRGAWALLLAAYSGQDDVVFGATLAGRPPELDGSLEMVGMFINTLPVRVRVDSDAGVLDWLGRLQEWQVQAARFESTPLVEVQGWSEIGPGEPLFESLLAFENVPESQAVTAGLETSDVRYLQRSNYPLAVLVLPGTEYEVTFLYDADRFDPGVISRMPKVLMHVLETIASAADKTVGAISVLPDSELNQLIVEWNPAESPYPADRTMHGLIVDAADAAPDTLAVVAPDGSLTYAELTERSEQVANALRTIGISPNDRVGICLERSPAMIVALLGVLRSGAAYVPMDPGLPDDRIALLMDETSAAAIIVAPETDEVAAVPHVRLHADGTPSDPPGVGAAEASGADATPDDLAYVLYTSGSTGVPKGVAVTHRNLVNSTHARLAAYGGPVGTFLLLSPFIFDSSVVGIYSTLAQGGTLVLPGARMEQDVHHLADLIATHRVTHTLALPTLYGLLLELVEPARLSSLELVMVAGEACPPSLIDTHFAALPDTALANEYGPTEATVWCTVHHLTPADARRHRVPIGRAIANTQAYVLDAAGRPTPVGVPGELHIGGVNVTRGYLGDTALTAERFVTIDLPRRGPTRLYRTGDVARWLPDGAIDLLGRVDHQVKIRGQRIELGEVEAVLRDHPAVRDAAVVVANDGATPSLVAYVEGTIEDLRPYTASRLPDAMVPARFVELDALPKGSTGKLDRSALPEVPPDESAAPTFVAPQSDIEKQIAAIWQTVLRVDTIGATDNFFTLGGDSISSIRVIAQAHAQGIAMTPKEFFDHPTVAGLAAAASDTAG